MQSRSVILCIWLQHSRWQNEAITLGRLTSVRFDWGRFDNGTFWLDHLHVTHAAVCRWNCWVECFAIAARAIQQGVHVVKIRQKFYKTSAKNLNQSLVNRCPSSHAQNLIIFTLYEKRYRHSAKFQPRVQLVPSYTNAPLMSTTK